jgi:hypothetical protein
VQQGTLPVDFGKHAAEGGVFSGRQRCQQCPPSTMSTASASSAVNHVNDVNRVNDVKTPTPAACGGVSAVTPPAAAVGGLRRLRLRFWGDACGGGFFLTSLTLLTRLT